MVDLPFGKTTTTASEVYSLIDFQAAVDRAQNGEVNKPENRIEEFVKSVPDLFEWVETHGREYLWRKTTDPCEVYMAEILLQRTRADAVECIYENFIERFPDPETLSEASEEQIRDVVKPLGFVNHRTRTLQEVGDLFTAEYDGDVPNSVNELMRPWRAGDYSARRVPARYSHERDQWHSSTQTLHEFSEEYSDTKCRINRIKATKSMLCSKP